MDFTVVVSYARWSPSGVMPMFLLHASYRVIASNRCVSVCVRVCICVLCVCVRVLCTCAHVCYVCACVCMCVYFVTVCLHTYMHTYMYLKMLLCVVNSL